MHQTAPLSIFPASVSLPLESLIPGGTLKTPGATPGWRAEGSAASRHIRVASSPNFLVRIPLFRFRTFAFNCGLISLCQISKSNDPVRVKEHENTVIVSYQPALEIKAPWPAGAGALQVLVGCPYLL